MCLLSCDQSSATILDHWLRSTDVRRSASCLIGGTSEATDVVSASFGAARSNASRRLNESCPQGIASGWEVATNTGTERGSCWPRSLFSSDTSTSCQGPPCRGTNDARPRRGMRAGRVARRLRASMRHSGFRVCANICAQPWLDHHRLHQTCLGFATARDRSRSRRQTMSRSLRWRKTHVPRRTFH